MAEPGSREAGVAEFIDFMVFHDDSLQYPFRLGLSWMNAHSERLHGKKFIDLTTPSRPNCCGISHTRRNFATAKKMAAHFSN